VNLHNFNKLAEPIKADPERQANLQRLRVETLAELLAYNLAELRKIRALTQSELAAALGVKQPSVSRVELTDDLQLSTLRAYVEALGGTVEVTAVFGAERFPIALP
jgi:predicted XRE-type DNA-binding protein